MFAMRFEMLPVSRASIVATAALAAVAGVASVAWTPPSEQPLDAAIAQFTEEVSVVAPEEGLAMEVASVGTTQLGSGEVLLETRIENRGSAPILISEEGVFDLSVQKVASPRPMGLGDVTFLALYQVAKAKPVLLVPGQVLRGTLRLAATAPFDSPGRYVIRGLWNGGGARATVTPFELVIDECSALACRAAGQLSS
jgi:hypothetical protein